VTARETTAALPQPRTQSRDARRTQLIEATIATLADRGFSRTTLTEVAKRAGLSHGLVLFHFQSKENLLSETLDYLSEEYSNNWRSALAAAGPAPEAQLAAIVKADFSPVVCTPERLASWCAFWGESQSRPLYQARCGANDAHYNQVLEQICERMNSLYDYSQNPKRAARLVRIMTEGVWLDMMTLVEPYPIQEALDTVLTGVGAFYPRHFGS
jgi:TetR/AcrR family transcriptional regulator, transcriptional repressor of bet genes